MRKEDKLFDAIGLVREELIEEAQDYAFRRRTLPWQRMAALAASLLFVAGVGFGALRLGLAGGMGGGSKDSAATENCAPKAPESGREDTGDAAPAEPEEAPEVSFTASVLEIHDGYLLVEPDEGEDIRRSADKLDVPTGELADLPVLEIGDRVTVTFSGAIQETYPARITGVISVEKLTE